MRPNITGGEASLVLPDLNSGPDARHERQELLMIGLLVSALGMRVRVRHAGAGAKSARPQVDDRDLEHHLGDLQDVSDHSGQVHPAPRALHRLDHRLLLRTSCSTSRRSRSPVILAFSLVGIARQLRRSPGSASASTLTPTRARRSRASRASPTRLRDPAQGRHEHRHGADQRRAGHHAVHPAVRAAATTPAPASSVSRSANRSAPRRCASPAASSPRSPTSART